MRLRTGFFALLVLVAVVLSGVVYVGFAIHKDEIVDQERQQVRTVASVVATDIESHISSRKDLIELWARNSDVASFDAAIQRRALEDFVDQTTFEGGSIIAPNGSMVAFQSTALNPVDEKRVRNDSYGDRPYVRAALDGRTYVSDPFEAESGTEIVAISTPIFVDGSVSGVFTGSLHLSDGAVFDDAAPLSEPGHRVTVSAAGRTVYADESEFSGATLSSTSTVDGIGWEVTVSQSRSSLTAHLQRATALQFGAVALVLLSLGAIGAWMSYTTISNIDELLDGFDDVEQGSYDRELSFSVSEEWEAIGESYNSLSKTLQRRESQLRVLNRVLRHNLRNDMNVVIAHAENILANDDTPADAAEDAEKILATANRLLATSDHARAFYEDLLSDGRREPGVVDAVSVVEARVRTLREAFPDCTIRVELPDSAPVLDTTALPVVVEEIVHNAIVHNDLPPSDREVTVAVENEPESDLGPDGEVRIRVADNGPGIPMVEEALLTNRLEETPVEHGSGLGVWLVNWLVDQLGGTVEAHSGIERGTTVTVRVPAASDDAE